VPFSQPSEDATVEEIVKVFQHSVSGVFDAAEAAKVQCALFTGGYAVGGLLAGDLDLVWCRAWFPSLLFDFVAAFTLVRHACATLVVGWLFMCGRAVHTLKVSNLSRTVRIFLILLLNA
jgi:hypothetical protein